MANHEVFSRLGWRYWIIVNPNDSDIYIQRGRDGPMCKKKLLTEGSDEWNLMPDFWKQYCLTHWDKFPVNYEP